jgi:hypothetical protein
MRIRPTSLQQGHDLRVGDYRMKQTKKAESEKPCLLPDSIDYLLYFLNNFLLPYPANPISPEPRRSMVAGSGTGVI